MNDLSTQERVVLRLLASGFSAKEAAQKLDLSEHTVRSYAKSVRAKLGVHSMCAASVKAERAGLLAGVEV